jgi:hypothetical protein
MLRAARALSVCWLVCLLLSSPSRVAAEPSDASQRAAAEFDLGVQAYKQADYARATEAFLAADRFLPSVSALSNALAAARRAGLPLLIARVAERSLARPGMSESDRKSAESALAAQGTKLSRLEISCALADCAPLIDGLPREENGSYVLPGEHRISAEGHVATTVSCEAGTLCGAVLAVPPPVPTPAAAAASAPSPAELVPRPEAAADPRADEAAIRRKRRVPLALFVSTGAGAVLLLSLATWQGVKALQAKNRYQDDPNPNWDDVTGPAHRSDFLLAGGVVLAAASLATAIWWVDWSAYGSAQLSLMPGGGATLTARRRF